MINRAAVTVALIRAPQHASVFNIATKNENGNEKTQIRFFVSAECFR